jgi:beta-lactamase regulating signal transducer with metallopeptidase domain
MSGALAFLLGRALAHSVWQGAMVLAGYLAARRMLAGASPRTRQQAAAWALVLTVALPVLTLLLSRSMAVLDSGSAGPTGAGSEPAATVWLRRLDPWLSPRVTMLLAAAWLAGVGFGLARIGLGVVRLRRLVGASLPLRLPGLTSLAGRAGLRQAPRVVCSPRTISPLVTGWRRPVLVLPAGFEGGLTAAEVEAILLHELAHLERRDFIRNLIERAAAVLAWHQVGVRWLLADLQREREHCCDEQAIAATGRPLELARALVSLERRRMGRPRLALAGTGGDLRRRIERILSRPGEAARPGMLRPAWAGSALLGAAMAATFLAGRAEASRLAGGYSYIFAHDPAGPFTIELAGDRLVGATLDGREIPPNRIVQQGHTAALLDASGRTMLSLEVRPGVIRWEPRAPRSP